MKIFLSAIETGSRQDDGRPSVTYFVENGIKMKWNLMSYFYIRGKDDLAEYVKRNSDEVLIDSGAHSFQKGKKVDWVEYTKEYAEFIKRFDSPKVVGYFEMDVDNIIGYDKVLELRKILETVSNKIIPVWHKNRGIEEFKKMCRDYAGRVIAITGFKNEDIKDEQYLMFLKYAKSHGCKVHCLGMTRKKILDKVPFDYVDSSSWKQNGLYGSIKNDSGARKVTREFSRTKRDVVWMENYKGGMQMQEHYHKKWQHVCKD